jgi:hypothetical protein
MEMNKAGREETQDIVRLYYTAICKDNGDGQGNVSPLCQPLNYGGFGFLYNPSFRSDRFQWILLGMGKKNPGCPGPALFISSPAILRW